MYPGIWKEIRIQGIEKTDRKGERMGENRRWDEEYRNEKETLLDNRYQLQRPLGKGGNGSVYLCFDIKLQKEWAVKKIETVSRVEQSMEWELLKTISCSVFPRIVDVIKNNGCIFIVMDYIEGITLEEKVRMQILTEKDVFPWALEIAKGILYLHKMRPTILYMDCKPGNIMLTRDGEIRLIDLGSAYICINDKKQRVSGTRFYAPREQRGDGQEEKPDVRTDIYAFGMTLYYLLTGSKKEWRKKGRLCVKEKNPNISWGMSHIIEKCTMENPKNRYQSMEEVLDQLCHIRSLGRWKAGKVRINRMVSLLMKAGYAGMILLAALRYRVQGGMECLLIGVVLLGLLMISVWRKRFTMYEINRDIFCGNGKRVLYILVAVMGLLGIQCIRTYAADEKAVFELGSEESDGDSSELEVILYDRLGRKILIKDGTSWETDEDIIMVIPIEEVSGNEGRITVDYIIGNEEKHKQFAFSCYRK